MCGVVCNERETAPLQDWPVLIKVDKLPSEQVDLLSVSSPETLQLSLSPACFESVRDVLELARDLCRTQSSNASAGPSTVLSPDISESTNHQAGCAWEQCRTDQPHSEETFNLFEIANRTGLGMACYPALSEQLIQRKGRELGPSNVPRPVTFRPDTELVYVPDFGRKVRT